MRRVPHMEIWSLIDQGKFAEVRDFWGNRIWTVEKVTPLLIGSGLVRRFSDGTFNAHRRLTTKDIDSAIESASTNAQVK